MENIVEKWIRENPNMNFMTEEGQKKFAQDTCPLTFSKAEVEMEKKLFNGGHNGRLEVRVRFETDYLTIGRP